MYARVVAIIVGIVSEERATMKPDIKDRDYMYRLIIGYVT